MGQNRTGAVAVGCTESGSIRRKSLNDTARRFTPTSPGFTTRWTTLRRRVPSSARPATGGTRAKCVCECTWSQRTKRRVLCVTRAERHFHDFQHLTHTWPCTKKLPIIPARFVRKRTSTKDRPEAVSCDT
uniref:(northern house mosquito) hypothetical protein n=1 Tax=Culex pipiens TaxID=7175 RepID=A0A8D8A1Q4_CULPI